MPTQQLPARGAFSSDSCAASVARPPAAATSREPNRYLKEPLMATSPAASTRADGHAIADRGSVRRSTETKSAFKTTELIAYVVAVAGVLIAALVVDNSDPGSL